MNIEELLSQRINMPHNQGVLGSSPSGTTKKNDIDFQRDNSKISVVFVYSRTHFTSKKSVSLHKMDALCTKKMQTACKFACK